MKDQLAGTLAVVFDVGWTLFDEEPRRLRMSKWLSDRLEIEFNITVSPFDVMLKYEELCKTPDPNVGSLTRQTMLELGVPQAVVLELFRRSPWHSFDFKPYSYALPLVRLLRDRGYRLGVVSNQGAHTHDVLKAEDFNKHFEFVFVSDVVGSLKPDPKMFRMMQRHLGIRYSEIVYVGDRLDHDVIPCQTLGMKTIRVRSGPHAGQQLDGEADVVFADINQMYHAVMEDLILCSCDVQTG